MLLPCTIKVSAVESDRSGGLTLHATLVNDQGAVLEDLGRHNLTKGNDLSFGPVGILVQMESTLCLSPSGEDARAAQGKEEQPKGNPPQQKQQGKPQQSPEGRSA